MPNGVNSMSCWFGDSIGSLYRATRPAVERIPGPLCINFISSQEGLDTSTPMGKAMFTIIDAVAELERNIIRERVVAGMEYARRDGTKSGNAIGRAKTDLGRYGRPRVAVPERDRLNSKRLPPEFLEA